MLNLGTDTGSRKICSETGEREISYRALTDSDLAVFQEVITITGQEPVSSEGLSTKANLDEIVDLTSPINQDTNYLVVYEDLSVCVLPFSEDPALVYLAELVDNKPVII